jgi:hypothetical protein
MRGCVGTCDIAHRNLGRITSYHRCLLQIMKGVTIEQDSSRYFWSVCGINHHEIGFVVFGHVNVGDTMSAACRRHAGTPGSYIQCVAVFVTESIATSSDSRCTGMYHHAPKG